MAQQLLLGARYNDPRLAQFLIRDPSGYVGGLNLHAYAGNNPASYVDPGGDNPLVIGVAVSTGIGLVVGGLVAWHNHQDIRTGMWHGAVLGFAGGMAATGMGAGVAALIGETGLVPGALAGFSGGAAGDAAQQGLALLLGWRQCFSVPEVAGAGALGGLIGGAGGWWAASRGASAGGGGATQPGVGAPEPIEAASPPGVPIRARPDVANLTDKIIRQSARRGWTPEMILEAFEKGEQFRAINRLGGANTPATGYVHPETGQYVVVDDATGEVIQVGAPGYLRPVIEDRKGMDLNAFPPALQAQATVLGGEPAWPMPAAREVVEFLRQHRAAILGIEVLTTEAGKPRVLGWSEYQVAFAGDWSRYVDENADLALMELAKDIPSDALINLTWVESESELLAGRSGAVPKTDS